MNKSWPKRKQVLAVECKYGVNLLRTGALNGGTLSLFFNENKKENLECWKPWPENEMENIYY